MTLGENPIVIGTHPAADLKSSGKNLHRRHAVIAQSLQGWFVFDLRSRYGITVNGEKVTKHHLQDKDLIQVGPVKLTVQSDPGETTPSQVEEDEEDHSWLDQVLLDSKPGRSFSSRCRLDFYLDGKLHRSIVSDADSIIGTSVRANIRLPRKGVSSLHCLLAVDSGTWTLYDLKSDNGIVQGDKRLSWLSLHEGDEFHIGQFRVLFRLQPDTTELEDSEDLVEDDFEALSTPSSGVITDASFDSGVTTNLLDSSDGTDGDEGRTKALDSKVAQASKMERDHQYEQAVQLLRQVCRDAPYVLKYRKSLRRAQIALYDSQRQPRTVKQAWAEWRTQMLAARAYRNGDDELALDLCEEGLTLDPWNKAFLILESLVFENRQLLRHCIWSLTTARRKAPNDIKINRALAKINQHLGEYDNAERYWNMVLKAEPENREADRQLRAVLVQKTLQKNRYQGSDSWENLMEA